MKIRIFQDRQNAGAAAAKQGAELIRRAIDRRGYANIIIATGASQFDMMATLVQHRDIAWNRVIMFHLDEYVGLEETHPASFRKYIRERFINRLPQPLQAAYLVDGSTSDPVQTCHDLNALIQQYPIDVAFIGIGENGHIAFNDPPADFNTESPYIVVTLDEACRRQQLGEGWFPSLEDVPTRAISMSVRHILKSAAIINTVPDQRKARAVADAAEGALTPLCPASVLRFHPDCTTFLDDASASLLSPLARELSEG